MPSCVAASASVTADSTLPAVVGGHSGAPARFGSGGTADVADMVGGTPLRAGNSAPSEAAAYHDTDSTARPVPNGTTGSAIVVDAPGESVVSCPAMIESSESGKLGSTDSAGTGVPFWTTE